MTILTRLQLLCNKANEGEAEISEELVEEFGELCKDALRKQFTPNEKEFKIRMSQIGKPLRYQQCELLDLPKDEPEPYNTVLKFLYGDVAEAILVVLLKAAGVKVQDLSKKVSLDIGGVNLEGEYDIRINDKIYDIKSASPFAFDNKFSKGFEHVESVDTFGYVTQLYLYSEAEEGTDVGGWIVLNKVTGEVQVVEPPVIDHKIRERHLRLAKHNIKALQTTTSLSDVDSSIPTEIETYYKKPTGKRVLHSDYFFFPYKKALWGDRVQYKSNRNSTAKVKPKKFYVVKEK